MLVWNVRMTSILTDIVGGTNSNVGGIICLKCWNRVSWSARIGGGGQLAPLPLSAPTVLGSGPVTSLSSCNKSQKQSDYIQFVSCFRSILLKGGVVSEGIFNLIPSSKKHKNHCPSNKRKKEWETLIWFGFSDRTGFKICKFLRITQLSAWYTTMVFI